MNLFTPEQRPDLLRLSECSRRSACLDDESNIGAPACPPEPTVDSDEVTAIRKKRLRVLLVDDNDLFRSGTAYLLREIYSAEVHEEETGDGALEKAGSGFDLILMDVKMPGWLDGLDTCAEIRRRSLAVQVVLMTAEPTLERRERAEALGVRLLLKPLDFEILERILLGCPGGLPS